MPLMKPTLLLALLAPLAVAQFVPAPTDLITKKGYAGINVRYKQVPTGICELDPKVKSYSGYADVGENEHIFWWFFEARDVDPTEAPLTTWINGGPGSSSMIGLFQELGPCGVDSHGDVYNNPYSWTRKSNMLFIDQPATVGFSYTKPVKAWYDPVSGDVHPLQGNTCPKAHAGNCGTLSTPDISLVPNNTQAAAPNFYKLLQGFMGAFPQYARNGFHFTTESYGGHYGPVFSEYIEQQNANLKNGAKEIHLQSTMIGNGWYDPIIQYQAYYNYSVFPGNPYDYDPYNKTIKSRIYNNLYGKGKCLDQLKDCKSTNNNTICSNADAFCALYIEEPLDRITGRDEYDIRELNPDPFPYGFFPDYLNSPKVLKAIGAFVNFTSYSNVVGSAFAKTGDDARARMTIADSKDLIKRGVYVVMYAGDADYNCNYLGGEAVSKEVAGSSFNGAGYANLTTSDHVVHGQVKQAGNYAFVRIFESGHEVPFYQPLASLEMFERVIAGVDVETGTKKVTSGLKTNGPAKTTYREGGKTVQHKVLPPDATYNTTTNAPNPA